MSDRRHDIEPFDPPVRSILVTGDRVQVRPTSGRLYRGRPGTITAIREDAADVCLDFRGTQTYPLEDLERIDREFRVGEPVRPLPGRPFAGSVLRVESIHRCNPTTYRLSNDLGVVTHNYWNDELERMDGGEVDGDLAGEGVAGPEADDAGGSRTGDHPATAPAAPADEAVAPEGADSLLTEPAFAVRDEVLVLGKVYGDIIRIDPDSETPYVVGDAFGEVVGSYHARDLHRVPRTLPLGAVPLKARPGYHARLISETDPIAFQIRLNGVLAELGSMTDMELSIQFQVINASRISLVPQYSALVTYYVHEAIDPEPF